MKTLACGCLTILLLLANPALGPGQSWLENTFSTNVSVTTTWTDTGYEVTAGDSLFIRAHGSLSGGAADWDGWFGPDGMIRDQSGGCVDCPLTGFPQGALIARIGAGSPFYVGSFSSFSCDAGGLLYLAVNDNSPESYVGTMRAFVWGGTAVPPPVINCDPGSCSSYWYLGSIAGDDGSEYTSDASNGARWFTVLIREDDGTSGCVDLSATIRLTPPAGADYDLYVYCDDCVSVAGSSTQGGSAVEEVQIKWEEDCVFGIPTGTDSGRYVNIRVDCSSVSIEDNWTLEVWGNTGAPSYTCSPR